MVASLTANRDSFTITTLSDQDIRLTRLFNAPRDLVFEAMTRPEHVREWWGRLGDGYSVPVCEIDLRVGGTWRFVNRHPRGEAAFHGEYREIAPPGRVVFTEIFEEFPDSAWHRHVEGRRHQLRPSRGSRRDAAAAMTPRGTRLCHGDARLRHRSARRFATLGLHDAAAVR
jgi:uncharacterized protein YndB with AHSA1/START domain